MGRLQWLGAVCIDYTPVIPYKPPVSLSQHHMQHLVRHLSALAKFIWTLFLSTYTNAFLGAHAIPISIITTALSLCTALPSLPWPCVSAAVPWRSPASVPWRSPRAQGVFFFYNGLNHSLGTSPSAGYSGLGREVPSLVYTGGVQHTSSCQRVVLGRASALRRLCRLSPYFQNAIIFDFLGSSSSPVQSPWVFGYGRWRFWEATFASGFHLGSAAGISAMAVL